MEEEKPKEKKTWYEMNKEQIKLIQWLLYHLRKHKRVEPDSKKSLKIVTGEVIISLD